MRRRVAIAAGLCALVVGCGDGSTETASERSPDSATTATVWFTSGEQFRTVERPLPRSGARIEPALEAVIDGPTEAERSAEVDTQTQIPEGTSLEAVRLSADGKVTIAVSPRFLAGIPRDPELRSRAQRAELDARLAQVTYTATQFDRVEAARVVSGGTVLDPSLTRADYQPPEQGPPPIRTYGGTKAAGTRKVQTRLAELRYLPESGIDGRYGYQTEQAVIAFQAWEGLERDGIVGPITAAALREARRPKPRGRGPRRRIEVYREKGVALLIKRGRTARAIHVSAGAPGTPTPRGSYRVFRKELQSWSVPFSTWLPYASYFNRGIAFHEYPDVPPYPASHGCVRVPAPEARKVYAFAAIDRAVIVY